jgi:acyl-CoA dehydrogenase
MTIAANSTLTFGDEQGMILDSAREFCRHKSPISAVRALLDNPQGFDPVVWQEMADLGWMGLAIPEAFGGSELGVGALVPIAECMGRNLLSTPFFSSTLAAQALIRAGSRSQQEAWLPQIATGTIATLALLENEDWGDEAIATTASIDGDQVRLQGEKSYVADAAMAELFLVKARCDGKVVLVLVESSQLADAAIKPHTLIDETKRAAKVDFSGINVPIAALIQGEAVEAAVRDVGLLGALLVAAEATGSAAACLDTVVEYLKTRKQFGKLIGSYQALKHPAADMLCQMDSARSHIYHAASVVADGPLDADAEIACRMAKAQATDALEFGGDRAVQFHGGMGFTYECDAQLYIRRAQWTRQQFGDSYHHRKRLAGLLLD